MGVTPTNGGKVDCILDNRPAISYGVGFVGAQALLPTLAKCPNSEQFQAPWFQGPNGGAGLCPPEYWNIVASLPGILFIVAGIAINIYANKNRLLISNNSLNTVTVDAGGNDILEANNELVPFDDIASWSMTPVGLKVDRISSSSSKIFFAFWDAPSVEAVLDDRLGSKKK